MRKEEDGFTLSEVLVAMTMMIMVLFALYSIFDMSIRVFSFGNDKTEAVQNARLGLEKMEREIRAAYPYDKPAGRDHLLWSPGSPATGAIPPSDRTWAPDTTTRGSRRGAGPRCYRRCGWSCSRSFARTS